ncbi:hypothetical protein CKO15_01670 [Halorhodospira abdelmalekii]|uniref:uroporphyrinogen-III synthase n=1 Tax=Halorhodospira abdelmalekii TaxID=421629 RepID=UPI001904B32A|nr:uroporphyrinogen-III synthase [Halorhodospira abdelmalekii]MBK1734009.1 hypothetical protein [Halorhodospira abdelmalekii]
MNRGSLEGVGVVVTRPAQQAAALIGALEREGAAVLPFPALEIVAGPEDEAMQRAAAAAAQADWLIFVSPNAVAHGLPRVRAAGGPAPQARIATVGQGTAQALRRSGVGEVYYPTGGATSEDLLRETPLGCMEQTRGARVVIVRGRGGRQHLADTLRRQGAEVEFLEVYRRNCPATEPRPLLEAAAAGQIQVALITSGEVLENFLKLIGERGREWFRRASAVVIGERVAALAAPHVGHVEVTATAAEDELIAAAARAAAAVKEIQE